LRVFPGEANYDANPFPKDKGFAIIYSWESLQIFVVNEEGVWCFGMVDVGLGNTYLPYMAPIKVLGLIICQTGEPLIFCHNSSMIFISNPMVGLFV
jgi:hypothetical protein